MLSDQFQGELEAILEAEVEKRVCDAIAKDIAGFSFDGREGADWDMQAGHMVEAFTSRLAPKCVADLTLVLLRHCLQEETIFYNNLDNELNDGGWSRSLVRLGKHWTEEHK